MDQEPLELIDEKKTIVVAQRSLSYSAWLVGECATIWIGKFARGRTDGDFGELIAMSGDQVYQRRRVFEKFGAIRHWFPNLRWAHFLVALNWTDCTESLEWANENHATFAEMKAWRRLQRGEDVTDVESET